MKDALLICLMLWCVVMLTWDVVASFRRVVPPWFVFLRVIGSILYFVARAVSEFVVRHG